MTVTGVSPVPEGWGALWHSQLASSTWSPFQYALPLMLNVKTKKQRTNKDDPKKKVQCSTEDSLEKWAELWGNRAVMRSAARLQRDDGLIFRITVPPYPSIGVTLHGFSHRTFVSLIYKSKASAVLNKNICAAVGCGTKADDLLCWKSTAVSLYLQPVVQSVPMRSPIKLQFQNYTVHIVKL